jgi:hypothetical protein
MRDNAYKQASNALLASELGRLNLTLDDDGEQLISDAQLAAGEKWGRVVVAYYLAVGTPRGPKSADLERGSHGEAPDPDSDRGQERADRDRHAVKRMQQANVALMIAGPVVADIVLRTCAPWDENVSWDKRDNLRKGLTVLVRFFGLTEKR